MSDLASIISDIASVTTSFIVAFLAVYGINQWKRQKKWAENRNLAKRVLVDALKMRDIIAMIRFDDIPWKEKELIQSAFLKNKNRIEPFIMMPNSFYREQLTAQKNILDATLLEAEAEWGEEFVVVAESFMMFVREVNFALEIEHSYL